MWTELSFNSRSFRNAKAVLEAGGYVINIELDAIYISKINAGIEWECRSQEEFFDVCAFYCWEAFDSEPMRDTQPLPDLNKNHWAPVTDETREWTSEIHEDLELQQAVMRFYEKGYAIRIKRGSISFFDRMAVQHDIRSKESFILASLALGTERAPSGKNVTRHPPVIIRGGSHRIPVEILTGFDARLKAAEARTRIAEKELDRLRGNVDRYERLKNAIISELDPLHTNSSGIEKIIRGEIFKLFEIHINNIENN